MAMPRSTTKTTNALLAGDGSFLNILNGCVMLVLLLMSEARPHEALPAFNIDGKSKQNSIKNPTFQNN